MSASLAKAVAAEGVTVNTISPGTIHSAKLDLRFREVAAQLHHRLQHSIGRRHASDDLKPSACRIPLPRHPRRQCAPASARDRQPQPALMIQPFRMTGRPRCSASSVASTSEASAFRVGGGPGRRGRLARRPHSPAPHRRGLHLIAANRRHQGVRDCASAMLAQHLSETPAAPSTFCQSHSRRLPLPAGARSASGSHFTGDPRRGGDAATLRMRPVRPQPGSARWYRRQSPATS
jgi:hypothetical protein